MRKRINKNLILSFLIPFFICLLVSYCRGLIGDRTVLVSDMQGQYVSLLEYFRNLFSSPESIFYSFTKGIGGNMIGTVAYYIASPLNVILLLFNKINLTTGIWLLIILKISLSGLTMYLYLKDEIKKDNIIIVLFSICYALMAFNVNYFFNIMWLDSVFMLPIILLGINRITNNKSSLLYGISLFIAIFSNYYIGYMICLFSVIYFIYKLFIYKVKKDDFLKLVIKFGVASLLGGLIASILILPTFLEIKNSSLLSNISFGVYLDNNNFDIIKVISRFLIGSNNDNNILSSETCNIYTGILSLPLIYFYFINKTIDKRQKIIDGILLGFLFLGLIFPLLNLFWHGMSMPNGFNYRFSFIVSFFMILLSVKSFMKLDKIHIKHYLFFILGFAVLVFLVVLRKFEYSGYYNMLFSLVCLLLYLLLLYTYTNKKYENKKNKIQLLIVIFLCSELFFNFYMSIRDYKLGYKNEYEGHISTYSENVDKYKHDITFYRIEKDRPYTYLDSMLQNYNGVSVFASTLNKNVIKLFNNFGGNVLERSMVYKSGSTEVMDSLLGIRYFYFQHGSDPKYEAIDKFPFSKGSGLMFGLFDSEVTIYKNPYALSLGYMVNSSVKNFADIFVESNRYDNFGFQNSIIKSMTGIDDILIPFKIEIVKDGEYLIDITNNNDFYLNIPIFNAEYDDYIDIYINDKLVERNKINDYGIVYVKNKYEIDKTKLSIKTNTDRRIHALPSISYLNIDNFKTAVNELKINELAIEKRKSNYIKGVINVSGDKKVMATSIPYEEGWNILVDGKKVEYFKLFDSLIGIDLEEGVHNIEMTFISPGFKLGAIISIISLLIFTIYIIFEEKILNLILSIYKKYEEIINYLIMGVLTTIVSILTYWIFTKIGLNYIISTILSWVLSVIFAYITNKIFVFKSKAKERNKIIKEVYEFFKYRLLSLGIEVGVMIVLVDIILMNDMIAKLVTQVLVIILNYFFSKLFIFKNNN